MVHPKLMQIMKVIKKTVKITWMEKVLKMMKIRKRKKII